MVDNPNLSPMEALKLSRRMVDGHRGELFRLDLSFILWWLLMACTAGIAGIYVLPYYKTTQALYYQNFRMRALATGQLTRMTFSARRSVWPSMALMAPIQRPVGNSSP